MAVPLAITTSMLDQLCGDGINQGAAAADEGQAACGDAGEVFLSQHLGAGKRRGI